MDYAVVMAGGTGKRLWPLSRRNRPKQILKLLDGEQTLLRRCFQRLCSFFDTDKIIVLTNAGYVGLIRENLPEVPAENIIAEPCVRDTAGAIGLAASVLSKIDEDATMAIVTADQMIEPADVFEQAIKDALSFIHYNPDSMITFGIRPAGPSSQFGYIKCIEPQSRPCCKNEIYRVEAFKEKPDEKTARHYIEEGSFFWNSGMFVWKVKTILKNLEKFLPESVEPLQKIKADWKGPNQKSTLYEWFVKLPKISIDFAVMENAKQVYALILDCKWRDMGAFTSLMEFVESDQNNNIIIAGHSQLLDCNDNIIVTEQQGHLIAAIGLKDMVVAHTPDATLICTKEQTKRLKELLEIIQKNTGEKFL